ncbi:terminase small subunit [Chryseobacterium lactis]|uniref:Terminase small subunit n=1 Tax=Chryseobacterium lactis TaxID=1241981 RepID=A0A3G6RBX5_CHRLC|nr:terminase small subunit [Chryseobacterium lactis]AZA82180.1 terminase small subunit [Chryseobacterium lactis]AZB02561.1 terminase small subunit [Chryseobacterium lactis]PNW14144.1 terminase small subunit [Chryseobacterium lactis]
MNLTDKQKRFCEEYLIDLNATQAAIRSGYSSDNARQIGSENLSKLDIQNYISELQEKKSQELDITQTKVLQELVKIAFGDVKNYFDDLGRLINISDLQNDVSASIKSVTVQSEKTELRGEAFVESTVKKIESYDKLKAIDTINRMLGFYSKDNEQKKGDSQVTIFQLPNNNR